MAQAARSPAIHLHKPDALVKVLSHGSLLTSRSPQLAKFRGKARKQPLQHATRVVGPIRAVVTEPPRIKDTGASQGKMKLTAIVTIKRKGRVGMTEGLVDRIDALSDSTGSKVILEVVSSNPKTEKRSKESMLKDWAAKANIIADKVEYTAEFIVNKDFGLPGAITVLNKHQNEFYLETICIEGLSSGKVYFPCYSWVEPTKQNSERRIFFSSQAYLPSATPPGLKELREKEMMILRGNGAGMRKFCDRVYDYDVYNDLGNPDKDKRLARRTLGGSEELPYPRRCRTGRPRTKTGPCAETVLPRGSDYYVPRDETFDEIKHDTFVRGSFKVIMNELLPAMINKIAKGNDEFHCFTDIDGLYKHELVLRAFSLPNEIMKGLEPMKFVKQVQDTISLQFSQPHLFSRDKFSWLRDDEFGRQALAGVNPLQIECLKTFPPVSKLDPDVYGPIESAITAEHIERYLDGLTVEEALKQKKLFIVDYHDAFTPFVNRINALEGRKMYASRTIFYRSGTGTLMPVAIELSLPPQKPGLPGKQRVFTPGQDATGYWLWQLAKSHVASNDSGFHQLVNHWLRTHAVTEPYIIATHRQLSSMHPIAKLLQPHLRYTMEINAAARQLLISADGVIEKCFTPGPYSMEISSAAYKSTWRFDMEGLPADLINRGMAEEDHSQPHRLKLVIEDYPYAADGLLIWDAIKSFVDEYVSLYYSDSEALAKDFEIHGWWEEIKTQGHVDKKDEKWWPELKTKEDLAKILTSMIWVASAHHAAVNFGQYTYIGYVPNHPCMTRRLIPEQDEKDKEYQEFLNDPEAFFLSTISNRLQSTLLMAVLNSLSTHSPDEEYLGDRVHTNWTADATAKAASAAFTKKLEEIEKTIMRRNRNVKLKNRCGAGVIPYELLRPTSEAGVTGRGIPNSISI